MQAADVPWPCLCNNPGPGLAGCFGGLPLFLASATAPERHETIFLPIFIVHNLWPVACSTCK